MGHVERSMLSPPPPPPPLHTVHYGVGYASEVRDLGEMTSRSGRSALCATHGLALIGRTKAHARALERPTNNRAGS